MKCLKKDPTILPIIKARSFVVVCIPDREVNKIWAAIRRTENIFPLILTRVDTHCFSSFQKSVCKLSKILAIPIKVRFPGTSSWRVVFNIKPNSLVDVLPITIYHWSNKVICCFLRINISTREKIDISSDAKWLCICVCLNCIQVNFTNAAVPSSDWERNVKGINQTLEAFSRDQIRYINTNCSTCRADQKDWN